MLFFSQINSVLKVRHIILGQYLGIGALTAISIVAALGISVFPHEYIGLLGLVPIYLGVTTYADYKKESKDEKNIEKHDIQPSVIKVASITFANGGDNIGIYTPLFSNMNFLDVIITVLIFAFLIALWCFIAKRLAEYPFVQRTIKKYKHIFIPVMFVGLGILILMESDIITFIYEKIF